MPEVLRHLPPLTLLARETINSARDLVLRTSVDKHKRLRSRRPAARGVATKMPQGRSHISSGGGAHDGALVADGMAPPETQLSLLQRETRKSRETFRRHLSSHDVRSNNRSLDIARKTLRNRFLAQLFHYTFSSRTRGIETHIWTETSHPLVHAYRSKLASLELKLKAVGGAEPDTASGAGAAQARRQKSQQQQQQQQQLAQLTSVHAKVAQSFRSFLTEDEAFWRVLAVRLVALYGLEEGWTAVEALSSTVGPKDLAAEDVAKSSLERVVLERAGDALRLQAREGANRQRLIEIVQKACVCCGDLARYREQYRDETQHDMQHRHAAASGRTGRGGTGRGRGARAGTSLETKPPTAGPKDYARAAVCYVQAKQLIPSKGNPWNQLAVLASHRGDVFASVYYYYRALCVREPFGNARANLDKTLAKSLERWEESGGLAHIASADTKDDEEMTQKQVHEVMQDLVVLHSTFENKKQALIISKLPQSCSESLSTLLRHKMLGADTIVEIAATAIAALWLRRLGRGNSPAPETSEVATSSMVEQAILLHLCSVIRVFMDVGATETLEALAAEKESEMAAAYEPVQASRRLTSVVRRMLPAVRITSKWLKGHVDYLQRMAQPTMQGHESYSTDNAPSSTIGSSATSHAGVASGIDGMWASFTALVNVLRYAFPFDSLPSLGTSVGQSGMSSLDFEEDRDMRGFLPMKKSMLVDGQGTAVAESLEASTRPKASPNASEEHLVRIADILIDAKVIAEMATSPITFDDGRNSFHCSSYTQSSEANTRSIIDVQGSGTYESDQSITRPFGDNEWRDADESSEDAVDLAMRAMDERRYAQEDRVGGDLDESVDDDDDGEIILIPSKGGGAAEPPLPSHGNTSALPRSEPVDAPIGTRSVEDVSPGEPLTAQDLLLQVLNQNSVPGPSTLSIEREPMPPLDRSAAQRNSSPHQQGWPAAQQSVQPSFFTGSTDIWAPPSSSQQPSPQLPAYPSATAQSGRSSHSHTPRESHDANGLGWPGIPFVGGMRSATRANVTGSHHDAQRPAKW